MRRCAWIAAIILALPASRLASAGEPPNCEPDRPRFLRWVAPVGGWFPYGGGLLHWWNPHCFPCCCGPDDYCRKPLPCVCWPAYPPFYGWGLPPAAPEQPLRPRIEFYPTSLAPAPGHVTGERTP